MPDIEAPNCSVCKELFGTAEELAMASMNLTNGFNNDNNSSSSGKFSGNESPTLFQSPSRGSGGGSSQRPIFYDRKRHHCRSCGQAVCNPCSVHRQPVPERGWNTDVRVCDPCSKSIKC